MVTNGAAQVPNFDIVERRFVESGKVIIDEGCVGEMLRVDVDMVTLA